MPQRSRRVSTIDAVTPPAADALSARNTWFTRSAKVPSFGTACSSITAAKTTWMSAFSTGVCVAIAGRPGIGRSNKPASPSDWRRSLYTRTERSWVRPAASANACCGATSAASRIIIANRRAAVASSVSGNQARNLLMPSTTVCCAVVKVLCDKSKRTFTRVPPWIKYWGTRYHKKRNQFIRRDSRR